MCLCYFGECCVDYNKDHIESLDKSLSKTVEILNFSESDIDFDNYPIFLNIVKRD